MARTTSMKSLVATNVLYWVCAGAYSPFLSAYYARLGLDASQTGLLLAVTPLCAICVQPLWSLLADRLGKKRTVTVLLCLFAALSGLFYYLASGFVGVLLVTLLFSVFFSALLPLCDSIVIGLAAERSYDFSLIRMGGTIGYAVVVFLLGKLLDVAPQVQFLMVAVALIVFAGQLVRLPESRLMSEPKAVTDSVENAGGGVF